MKQPDQMSREELENELVHLRDVVGRTANEQLDGVLLKRWKLTERESQVIVALYRAGGRTVIRESLFDIVYGYEDGPSLKIIDIFVCKARKKMGDGMISTSWSRGYFMTHRAIREIDQLRAAPVWAIVPAKVVKRKPFQRGPVYIPRILSRLASGDAKAPALKTFAGPCCDIWTVLRRLESQGLIISTRGARRASAYTDYHITDAGRERLAELRSHDPYSVEAYVWPARAA